MLEVLESRAVVGAREGRRIVHQDPTVTRRRRPPTQGSTIYMTVGSLTTAAPSDTTGASKARFFELQLEHRTAVFPSSASPGVTVTAGSRPRLLPWQTAPRR